MPSQVSGAGSRPVVVQSQDGVNETKSCDLQKTPENTAQPSPPRSATPQEKSEKQFEKSMEGSLRKNLLHEAVHSKDANTNSSKKTKGKEIEKDTKPPTPKTMAEAQEEGRKLGTLQQSTEQVIKSIGDAVSTVGRKQ